MIRNNTQNNKFFDKNSVVFFATFSRYEKGIRLPTNGMVEPILSFFLPKVRKLVLLDAPHLISDTIEPIVEVYEKTKLKKRSVISRLLFFLIYLWCKIPSNSETRASYKLRDFLSVFIVAAQHRHMYDLFIGLEAVYAVAGLILRQMGIVKKVIYYVSDYSPRRFDNQLVNALYIWLDRFCVLNADYTWDVSLAIQKGRFEAGLPRDRKYNIVHVPNGLFPNQIRVLPIKDRQKYDLVYMGILEPDMGPDLAIKAFAVVLKKFPKARLHIIGGPERHIILLRRLVGRLRIQNSVIFHGFIPSFEDMAKTVRKCFIGLAPYRAFSNSKRWYGDAGKIRQYTASGLPVVTTQVPPYGRYVVEQGAGIMTKDSVQSFSLGILKLLDDEVSYRKLSRAAVEISRNNIWKNVYRNAFLDMLNLQKSYSR